MSQGKLKLIIDKKQEEQIELGAFDELYELYADQQKERQNASIWGKVLGGLLGYFTGGIGTAILYSAVAGEAGKWSVQGSHEQEVMDMLAKDTFGGGKFDAGDLQTVVDQEKDWAESRQDAYLYDTMMQTILTGTTLSKLPGDASFADVLSGSTPGGTVKDFFGTELQHLFAGGDDMGIESPLGIFGRNLITGYQIERAPESRDPEASMNTAAMSLLGNYFKV